MSGGQNMEDQQREKLKLAQEVVKDRKVQSYPISDIRSRLGKPSIASKGNQDKGNCSGSGEKSVTVINNVNLKVSNDSKSTTVTSTSAKSRAENESQSQSSGSSTLGGVIIGVIGTFLFKKLPGLIPWPWKK